MRWADPPTDEAQLLFRAGALAGRTLTEVAARLHSPVPESLARNKGWIGTLVEAALGAEASNRPVPDFERLGIELKTLPVTAQGKVRESTFVTTAAMDGQLAHRWAESRVRHKLQAVLWVPIVGSGSPGDRIIGQALLWRPSAAEEAQLRADWEELTELLVLGEHWQIDARRGVVLQLRPKGAHSESYRWTLGEEGDWVQEGPRGFYLRQNFTQSLLDASFRRP